MKKIQKRKVRHPRKVSSTNSVYHFENILCLCKQFQTCSYLYIDSTLSTLHRSNLQAKQWPFPESQPHFLSLSPNVTVLYLSQGSAHLYIEPATMNREKLFCSRRLLIGFISSASDWSTRSWYGHQSTNLETFHFQRAALMHAQTLSSMYLHMASARTFFVRHVAVPAIQAYIDASKTIESLTVLSSSSMS